MSEVITTDLTDTIDRHLDAYGEPDDARRDELVTEVWTEDGQLIDPPIDGTGRAGISAMAAAVQAHYPAHTFRRTSGIDAHHGFARYEWELVAPDGAVALVGLDVAELADDGRLRRVVGFLGPIPPADA
jgi:hypothetical protein